MPPKKSTARPRGVERFPVAPLPSEAKPARGVERFNPSNRKSKSRLKKRCVPSHIQTPETIGAPESGGEISGSVSKLPESGNAKSSPDHPELKESSKDTTMDELLLEEQIRLEIHAQDNPRPEIPSPTMPEEQVPTKGRPYQVEMFEESLKRNIIVCQPTGSGKTFIATLRIRHELEHGPSDKMCWFLITTQILGYQQFTELQKALPQVPMRCISGADNAEKWDKATWITTLGLNQSGNSDGLVRVVVSTHQVALDALTHGFITMDRLRLIVFDEAHHCTGHHPSQLIMAEFYHPRLKKNQYVPAILGLTASPIFNGGVDDLKIIEKNLNAICRTPTAHRTNLEKHVKLPVMEHLSYTVAPPGELKNDSYASLQQQYYSMSILDDPYLSSLQDGTQQEQAKLREILQTNKTYCQVQMKRLVTRSGRALEQLGSWAADFYIHTVIQRFSKAVKDQSEELVGWQDQEKLYLANVLQRVRTNPRKDEDLAAQGAVTPKVEQLISRLLAEFDNVFEGASKFSGLIFVDQRVDASILWEIISRHPATKGVFRCGTLMGSSHASSRPQRAIYELIDARTTKDTLAEFRDGVKNLLIATSVAEEGLDIPDCHLVLCFDPPKTMKSFVQIRGRARKRHSTYVLMSAGKDIPQVAGWKVVEEAMIEAYQDGNRQLSEPDEEEGKEGNYSEFIIKETGALLTYSSAIPHVHHFCAVLAPREHVDPTPQFRCVQIESGHYQGQLTLPAFVPPEIRQHAGAHKWKSQKMAKRDAAFQTYTKLYEEGLVDNNLMPIFANDPELEMEIKKKTSKEEVDPLFDPWDVEWTWQDAKVNVFTTTIELVWPAGEKTELTIHLPFQLPKLKDFKLWWTLDENVQVVFLTENKPDSMSKETFEYAQETTYIFLASIHRHRMEQDKKAFPYLFVPKNTISPQVMNALEAYETLGCDVRELGIVRDLTQSGKPFLFERWMPGETLSEEKMNKRYFGKEVTDGQPLLEVSPLKKKRNFYHREAISKEQDQHFREYESLKVRILPQFCTFDCLPWVISRMAFLIPSIIRRIEVYAVAKKLQDTVISSVPITDMELLLEAICATSAEEEVHYQRLEILGDSVLKLMTGVQVAAANPNWPEGRLSAKKDRSVANSRLATESIRLGMSRFIVTDKFTSLKWRPRYIGSQQLAGVQKRPLSTKTLADIVESLIGAAYLEGSYEKAVKMAKVFDLGIEWQPLADRIDTLHAMALAEGGLSFPPYLKNLETMIGYEFKKKSLLMEAITHPGYNSDANAASYQRLEFLGDSVLDMLAVEVIYRHSNKYSHVDIHRYKSSAVTADFLAFLCLGMQVTLDEPERIPEVSKRGEVKLVAKDRVLRLDKYLRHDSKSIVEAQAKTLEKYLKTGQEIWYRLYNSDTYPWTLLAGLEADKFFSDMVESILGAVFVDSKADWVALGNVAEKFGILKVLRRVLDDRVDVVQPVDKLGVHAAKKLREVKYECGEENKAYWCAVRIDGEEIVREGGGTKRGEVRIRAAEKAYEVLVKRDEEEEREAEEEEARMQEARNKEMETTGGEKVTVRKKHKNQQLSKKEMRKRAKTRGTENFVPPLEPSKGEQEPMVLC